MADPVDDPPYRRERVTSSAKRRFFVASSSAQRLGPYPSYDIARVMAEHLTFKAVEVAAADALATAFAERLRHARSYFGLQVQRWLEAGMPSRRVMPQAPEVDAIEPRMLARNGVALARYLGEGPGSDTHAFYDRLARRYLRAVHGFDIGTAMGDVRAFMEPFHASLAVRQLAHSAGSRDDGRRFQAVHETQRPAARMEAMAGLSRAEAAHVLRSHARFYLGFNVDLVRNNFTPPVRGKWDRFTAGAVILHGLERRELFAVSRGLLQRAAINHGIDGADNGVALRWMLLHLAQWCLASERGLL